MGKLYVFRRLFHYVAQYKGRLWILIAVGLFGVAFEVAKPLPIKMVIDNVLSSKELPAFVKQLLFLGNGEVNKEQLLWTCIVLMVIIAIGSALISMIVSNIMVKLAQKVVYDLSIDFYTKLQRLSLTFYSKNHVGDLVQRISSDVFVVYFIVAQIIVPAITSCICLVAMFYIMASIDLTIAFVAFAVVPLLILLLALYAKPMNNTTHDQYHKQGIMSAFFHQSLSSMKIIQAFARESFMGKRLEQHMRSFSLAFQLATRVSISYNQLCLLITGLASAGLVGFGAYRGLSGSLTAGDLFVFLGYITAIYGPVNSLSTAIGTAIAIGARGKRVFDILDSKEVVPEKKNAIRLENMRGMVEFNNVSFGYNQEPGEVPNLALKDISFKVKAGEIIAVVGSTGAGKTSLISLLTRFYDPLKGRILIDGVDIRDLQLQFLRENISLVMQDPFLFPMSIAENIAFGNPEASLEEIIQASKSAQAHDFISQLPNGYYTTISEAGSSLSGGEKQRIAIARAFLKKAPILILDEPTSAVDALTEAKIFEALNEFSRGKTVFLISHRLSTIKHANQIITIKDGCIVERGTHQSLLHEGNVYAGLYQYQHIN